MSRFTDLDLKTVYIRESAEIVDKHIPKNDFDYHLSSRLITINKIVELKHSSEYDIILIDRGMIDMIVFSMHLLAKSPNLYRKYSSLICFIDSLLEDFLPNYLLIFNATPEVSINRRGGEGSLVTYEFIKEQISLYNSMKDAITIPYDIIDTSNVTQKYVSNQVFNLILAHFSKSH